MLESGDGNYVLDTTTFAHQYIVGLFHRTTTRNERSQGIRPPLCKYIQIADSSRKCIIPGIDRPQNNLVFSH